MHHCMFIISSPVSLTIPSIEGYSSIHPHTYILDSWTYFHWQLSLTRHGWSAGILSPAQSCHCIALTVHFPYSMFSYHLRFAWTTFSEIQMQSTDGWRALFVLRYGRFGHTVFCVTHTLINDLRLPCLHVEWDEKYRAAIKNEPGDKARNEARMETRERRARKIARTNVHGCTSQSRQWQHEKS